MGCTSEKFISESSFNKNNKYLIITDGNFELDLQDIEQQGESKHPQKEINNNEKIEEEKNFYNYNLNDLALVNNTKMSVKRIENFEDDDEDDDEEDEDDDENKDGNKKLEENNEEEKKIENEEEINVDEERERERNKSLTEDCEKMPEDKKPPNIEKLRKKGKEKKVINFL